MKLIIACSCLIVTSNLIGQKQDLVDSISNEICKSMSLDKEDNDSIRVFKAFRQHLVPSLSNFSKNQRDSIGDIVYFRLQRNCVIFKELLDRNTPENKYWQTVYEKPQSKLSDSDCLQFQKHKNYKYIEPNGDTVNLKIDNGFWVDNFKNGTHSKLKVYWGRECYFDIEFVESDNDIRNKFSKPGDKYRYSILEKHDNYYKMSVEAIGVKKFSIFKIYY